VNVTIESPLHLSEDPEKVAEAMRHLTEGFDLAIEHRGTRLVAQTDDPAVLATIYEKLRARLSLSVARRQLRTNESELSTHIYFNKQAAYVKKINICVDDAESPLGAIKVTIRSPDPPKLIDWIAPRQRTR
jgi:predicted RNA binding protein with dsRBD fold (UPF0201 family)